MNALLETLGPADPDRVLAQSLDAGRLPGHVAVIMDGNGRWARQRHLPRAAGHKAGVEPVRVNGGNLRAPGHPAPYAVRVLGGELEASARRSGYALAAAENLLAAGTAQPDA